MGQVDGIGLDVKMHPDSRYVPPMDSISREGSSQQTEFSFNSNFGLFKRIDSANGGIKLLNIAVFGKYTSFSNTGYNKLVLQADLYSISTGMIYYSSMGKKWAYTVFFNAALNTDFINVDYNDLFLSLGVQFIRNFSPNFRLGFGAILHNNLGKPMFWPALSVYWNFGKRFNFDIRVPDQGHGLSYTIGVGYKLNSSIKLGVAFKPMTVSYDVTLKNEINNRLMNYWQLPFELSGTYKKGNFGYTATVGLSALRSFTYAEKDVKKMFTKYPYSGLNANVSIGLGVRYHF